MTREAELRQQLYDSFKNRAILYHLIYDELRQEVGAGQAEEILKRAIYRRGVQKGAKYSRYAPHDLQGLKEAFLGGLADDGHMFKPLILRDNQEGLDIKFQGCPLKDAWLELGLPEDEVATLCRIAATIDTGTFEGAGFDFFADTWQSGEDGCCCLHIRPGQEAASEASNARQAPANVARGG